MPIGTDEKKYLFGMEVASLLSILAGTLFTAFVVGVSYSLLVSKVEAQEKLSFEIKSQHRRDNITLRNDMNAMRREIKAELAEFRHEVKSDIKDISKDIKQILMTR